MTDLTVLPFVAQICLDAGLRTGPRTGLWTGATRPNLVWSRLVSSVGKVGVGLLTDSSIIRSSAWPELRHFDSLVFVNCCLVNQSEHLN